MYQFKTTPTDVPKIQTKHRNIRTAIPSPETIDILTQCAKFEPASMNDQLPVAWDSASGYQVFDRSGNCWIDFTSTIFVANIGHSHPKVVEAIVATARKNLLNAYYYPTEERALLSSKLVAMAPPSLNKVVLLSTGSEASEVSFKIAVKHGKKIRPSKTVVIAFSGSFHGKTLGSQFLGGKPEGKAWVGYQLPVIKHLPYPYPWVLEKEGVSGADFFLHSLKNLELSGLDLEDIAAFMAEPYQGWAAVFFPKDYVQAMAKWAKQHNALLGFDEVQAGFGRTGKLFGFEHYDVTPDIIWCGKALSASLPVSAVIAHESILDVDFSINSTHGGNPLGAAASYAALNVLIDEDLINESRRKGEVTRLALENWRKYRPDVVHEIYGKGLVWAVFIRNPRTNDLDVELVDRLIERAMQKGLLSIRTCCGTVKLGPPLSIPDEALVEGIEVLAESLDEILKEG